MSRVRITCKRSTIGYAENQRRVMKALGLRSLNSVVEHENSPQILGMVRKVRHLVEIEEISQDGEA